MTWQILQRVETGTEVIVERDAHPVAVIRPVEPVRRKISECIALMLRAVGAIRLGLILDSTAAVAAERRGKNARQRLESVALQTR